ncbi:plant-specific TFIIB-related protein PTF2 [Aristolochia californica]|uniref:plant-specific TFIIB-related protein PTF2 n=1 Tax=Aristolochia californica TaxID=171875 RepID=UPI0035D67690
MDACRLCNRCKQKRVILDLSSSNWVCESCGCVQQFDDFRSDYEAGFNVPSGTIVRSCTSTQGAFNYRENKIFQAHNEIEDITSKLNLSGPRSREVRDMIEKITEGEFGQGNWFQILIAAVSYIVIRINHLPPSISEVCASLGCDVHEVGRMVMRATEFLDLKLPEYDMVASLERAIHSCPSFVGVAKEKVEAMEKQGKFLLVCSVQWFLTTGRQPLPVVVAVLAFVAEVNEVKVTIEEIAKDLYAGAKTSKLRYKELKETFVKAAQALPWGKDITVNNIIRNTTYIIKYMEMKSKFEPSSQSNISKSLVQVDFDIKEALAECMQNQTTYIEDDYGNSREDDWKYFDMESGKKGEGEGLDDIDNFKLSEKCLWNAYREFLDRSVLVNSASYEATKDNSRKRKRNLGYWSGDYDSDKHLIKDHDMKKYIGFDALPPSFVAGREACKMRREKIKAAKQRINEVMHPKSLLLGTDKGISLFEEKFQARKRCSIDEEDRIIELLLLHQVKDEEIELGHYNTLLDLHVFNFVESNKKSSVFQMP